MSLILKIAGISKQAYWQYKLKQLENKINADDILLKAEAIREEHPKIGIRKLYCMLQPSYIGRDKFETILINNGFRVKYPRNYIRTTYSSKCYQYTNLIKGIELTDVNQVWNSDITYFWARDKFYYLIFIQDTYSRKIVGYQGSNNMRVEANIKALKMAFKTRCNKNLRGLIHHSDMGTQYASNLYTELLNNQNCLISMCKTAYENPYAERLNGIIKNEYLKSRQINNLRDLTKELDRAVYSYNNSRPHLSLINKLSPVTFENYILSLPAEKRPRFKLYTDGQKQEVNNV